MPDLDVKIAAKVTDIKIKVTADRFGEIVSIEDSMNFLELTNKEAYEYLLDFVVDQNDQPIGKPAARKLFKVVPRNKLDDYIAQFIKAIGEAFVNPTSGAV